MTDILNLSEGFSPKIKKTPGAVLGWTSTVFPGGEQHLRITGPKAIDINSLVITQRVNSSADIMAIILANDAARRLGYTDISLVCPYFPAARQDRVCNKGEPLTVRVNADLINGCGFSKVTILGPHSEVTPALLNNVEVIDDDLYFATWAFSKLAEIVGDANFNKHMLNVICPDAGAGKRVGKIASLLQKEHPSWRTINLIRCEKVRDVSDGSLKEFFVAADDLHGAPSIIFDDVVAYGGTFLGLAEVLRKRNCGPLGIFTYHADCQEGLEKLSTAFDGVFTTNSKRDYPETDKVKILPITV